MVAFSWSRASASRRSRSRRASVQRLRRAAVGRRVESDRWLRQTAEGAPTWVAWGGASGEGGQPAQRYTLPWSLTAAGGSLHLRRHLRELATALWPGDVTIGGAATGQAVYARRRMTLRSLSHLADPWDQPQPVRITAKGITQLQQILKEHFGLDYTPEQAQEAGQAILRVAGLKLLQELERERTREQQRSA